MYSLLHFVFIGLIFTEQEFLFVFPKELGATFDVHEERVNFADVGYVDLGGFALLTNQVARRNQMDRVTKRTFLTDLGE